ncbi:hypothetical protein B6S12_04225 [Helicobacter valdiviensis]|uniref:Chloramphenicol acetyltransferase n=1 Tax=Helicobacter valdiviensis TaxID=1458358 RepID=A0A2W6MV46_9HELI|nr:hypothetical protein B6S12_04225 [Helicobacter valdiviensis]
MVCVPIFTLFKIQDKFLLDININHAICNGYHIAKFIKSLQENINTLKTLKPIFKKSFYTHKIL